MRVFRQNFTLEDAIGSHEANMRVTYGSPLRSSLLLPVCTVNCVQTLKVTSWVTHGLLEAAAGLPALSAQALALLRGQ
jgi:hypothetical protein